MFIVTGGREEYCFVDIDYKYDSIFHNNYDKDIAKGLGLSTEEYTKILESYGARIDNKFNSDYYFTCEEDCLKCVEYLNETYGMILVLMEG